MTKIIRVCVGAPRRARQKRLVGAPPYVLAIYDEGEEYTVIFGWPLWEPKMGRTLPCLHFNAAPSHPACGVSMWGEVDGRWGAKQIDWAELPTHLQQHVISRANYPDKVKVYPLVKLPGTHTHKWRFDTEAFDRIFNSREEALDYALENSILPVKAEAK